MANEIAVLDRDPGQNVVRSLFLYPIASPVQVGGANVVPTPSADLPDLGALVLSAQEKAALDAGTLVFEVVSYSINPDMTAQQVAAALKTLWATRNAAAQARYTARFAYLGTRLNAP